MKNRLPFRLGISPLAGLIPAFLLLGLPAAGRAAVLQTWYLKPDRTIEARLVSFDFETKEAVCLDPEENEIRLPTAAMDLKSRMQLLLSPVFVRGYPGDRWTREQVFYVFLAVGSPALFMLVSFYLCAMLLMKSVNPFKTLIAWFGSLLLATFLMSFYVFMSAREPESATSILTFGSLVVTALLGLFVSIIYRTTMWRGLKLLLLHLFGAFFLILVTVLVAGNVGTTSEMDRWMEQRVFTPVGLTGQAGQS
ncbi:MAG: hypothetical protein KDM91_08765 [Verrucomicrobiae bacterium]|nr:hypothetical protein [Verrucomicrobiae bacterium]MCP5549683.1 hypothetical protein [Akkermansiaceae bacterium]